MNNCLTCMVRDCNNCTNRVITKEFIETLDLIEQINGYRSTDHEYNLKQIDKFKAIARNFLVACGYEVKKIN